MDLRSRFFKSIFFIAGVALVGICIWWVLLSNRDPISDFEDKRDMHDVLKIFERDRYWLLAHEDFSPEFMLKYRTPNTHIGSLGRLKIKVYRETDKLVGFTAYYMKTSNLGQLLFIAVNEEFRGKGYAEHLMRYALGQLQKMGAKQVQLVTRTNNLPAQELYKRIGFYEMSRDEGFVYFAYDL